MKEEVKIKMPTYMLSIPPAAFNVHAMDLSGGITLTNSPGAFYFAPVYLPQKAKITKLAFVVTDNVPGNDLAHSMLLNLGYNEWKPTNPGCRITGQVASVTSTDALQPNYCTYDATTTIHNKIVNNTYRAYFLELHFCQVNVGQFLGFYKAQIEFQLP
jgi:hypothetical protein